jgi:hypothetical protein
MNGEKLQMDSYSTLRKSLLLMVEYVRRENPHLDDFKTEIDNIISCEVLSDRENTKEVDYLMRDVSINLYDLLTGLNFD